MKTPWKFLVELTSRRRPAKGQESAIGHATDPEAHDIDTEQTQKLPSESSASADRNEAVPAFHVPAGSNEREAGPEAGHALVRRSDEAARTASANEASPSDGRADVPAPISGTSLKSQRNAPTKHRERAKRTQPDLVARSTIAAQETQRVQPSSSRDAFFDEVASLDEDIKTLKSELAQKLQLQNAQLKKMLKRFDVS